MTDQELLALFIQRDERAVSETQKQYGRLCRHIAYGILSSKEDAEEIANDVLMRAWDVIPREKPQNLGAFLAVMTRNLSTNRLDQYTAQRRGGGQRPAVLDELAECTASAENVEQAVDAAAGHGAPAVSRCTDGGAARRFYAALLLRAACAGYCRTAADRRQQGQGHADASAQTIK